MSKNLGYDREELVRWGLEYYVRVAEEKRATMGGGTGAGLAVGCGDAKRTEWRLGRELVVPCGVLTVEPLTVIVGTVYVT
jgi:hypothetical protein